GRLNTQSKANAEKVALTGPLFLIAYEIRILIFREEPIIKVLFIGDIVGSTGRKALKQTLPQLKSKYNPQIIIANGENAAGGRGITAAIAKEFFELGVHGLTMGNHT